jgi:pyruvate dehydrogenase E2 component (dihydrolipoamide acetyltransferase)
MSQGNILEWKKKVRPLSTVICRWWWNQRAGINLPLLHKVGDAVAAGELYCEVETDKATMGWESQEDGFIAQILLPSGSKDVLVGTPVIVMVDEKEAVAAFASYTAADGSKPKAAAAAAPSPSPAATAAVAKPDVAPASAPATAPRTSGGWVKERV